MKRVRLGVLIGLLLIVALYIFRGAGLWLDREDPLSRADIIFVLGGGMPQRAVEAGKIFAQGYAPEVWCGRPDSPVNDLARLGIHYVGEEDYNRQILMRGGVPESAIHILPGPVVNTEEELQELGREMLRNGKTTVILVTSPQHTRRVWTLWQKLVGKEPRALVHGAHQDPFDPDHWWRNTRDVLSVVRETLGLVNTWAGLPVPPYSK
jgi:uncharacterized SAM-binding protein YcdF (DUF218 family)